MDLVCVGIYDCVTRRFNHPNFFINEDEAIRYFKHLSTREGVPFSDLELYKLGMFNSFDGTFTPCEHVLLVRGE